MGNGSDKKKTTTTTSAPGSMMDDIRKGLGALLGRKKRMADASKIGAESGNPCHYQTHVGDKPGMNRQGRKGGTTCHHRK